MTDDLQRQMYTLGLEQIVLLKTLQQEMEQYELACLQAKAEVVLEAHRLKCEVALSNLLDKKRSLAESARKWSIENSRRQS